MPKRAKPMTRQQFLRSRGWRKYLGWWYRPGAQGYSQEIYGTARAFALEYLRLVK